MQFRATDTIDGSITIGNLYHGQIVSEVTSRNGEISTDFKVHVFDDRGRWVKLRPKIFMPADITREEFIAMRRRDQDSTPLDNRIFGVTY